MNQELILKAVKAVMEFNECQGIYGASVSVMGHSVYSSIIRYDNGENIGHSFKCEDLENFINKLNELKGEGSE